MDRQCGTDVEPLVLLPAFRWTRVSSLPKGVLDSGERCVRTGQGNLHFPIDRLDDYRSDVRQPGHDFWRPAGRPDHTRGRGRRTPSCAKAPGFAVDLGRIWRRADGRNGWRGV